MLPLYDQAPTVRQNAPLIFLMRRYLPVTVITVKTLHRYMLSSPGPYAAGLDHVAAIIPEISRHAVFSVSATRAMSPALASSPHSRLMNPT